MTPDDDPIRLVHDPDPAAIPADFIDWLRALGGPTLFVLRGEDRTRRRALSTLLHGNEPSGARALHRWLREGRRPRVDTIALVASVATALHEEPFRHRALPGARDLNRCFRAPFTDAPGRIAGRFLELLAGFAPECLVDIHNTSASSPPFGVAPHEDLAHEAMLARFCSRLVITDLSLGSLMEISGAPFPAVTVECGGARDPAADRIAWEGLQRYLLDADVLDATACHQRLDVYHHPVRLEFAADARIAWGIARAPGADFTVVDGLEMLNFDAADEDTAIGWSGERGLRALRVRNAAGHDVLDDYFSLREGRLFPARPLKLFMITANPAIALSDCLLYAAAEREHTRVRIDG